MQQEYKFNEVMQYTILNKKSFFPNWLSFGNNQLEDSFIIF